MPTVLANHGLLVPAVDPPSEFDVFDDFDDVANGTLTGTTEVGNKEWKYPVSGVARAPEVRDGYVGVPAAFPADTTYPQFDAGGKIAKMDATVRINTMGGTKTGTGWGIGLITWADGGQWSTWPTVPRCSGHIVFSATNVVYWYCTSLGGSLASSNVWNHGLTIPDDEDFTVGIDFDYIDHEMIVKIILDGVTHSTPWANPNIIGYDGEVWACYQPYHGGSASTKQVEFKDVGADIVPPPAPQSITDAGGIAPTGPTFGQATIGEPPAETHYVDSPAGRGNDPTGMGPDWEAVVFSGGCVIQTIVGQWAIVCGNAWYVHRNDAAGAVPQTGTYEVALRQALVGAGYRVYANAKVYIEWFGTTFSINTAETVGGAATVRDSVSGTFNAANDELTIRKDGNTFSGYKNGAPIAGLSWTDDGGTYAALTPQAYVGMWAASTAYRFDRVTVDDV